MTILTAPPMRRRSVRKLSVAHILESFEATGFTPCADVAVAYDPATGVTRANVIGALVVDVYPDYGKPRSVMPDGYWEAELGEGIDLLREFGYRIDYLHGLVCGFAGERFWEKHYEHPGAWFLAGWNTARDVRTAFIERGITP